MTISPYHVDSIIKAYGKQNKLKPSSPNHNEQVLEDKYKDVVNLASDTEKSSAYDKISYSLMDIIVKSQKGICK